MGFNFRQTDPTFVQSSDTTTWPKTYGLTTVSGNTLLAFGEAVDSSFDVMAAGSVADGGTNAWAGSTQSNLAGAGAFIRGHLFYQANCIGKVSHQVTITPTATGSGFLGQGSLTVVELEGMLAASFDQAATPTTGTATPALGNSITPSGNGVHIAVITYRGNSGTPTFTPNAGWTGLYNPGAQLGSYMMYRAAVSGVAQTPSLGFDLTPMADGWVVLHAVFLEASGVSGNFLNEPEWHPMEAQTNPLTIAKW